MGLRKTWRWIRFHCVESVARGQIFQEWALERVTNHCASMVLISRPGHGQVIWFGQNNKNNTFFPWSDTSWSYFWMNWIIYTVFLDTSKAPSTMDLTCSRGIFSHSPQYDSMRSGLLGAVWISEHMNSTYTKCTKCSMCFVAPSICCVVLSLFYLTNKGIGEKKKKDIQQGRKI